MKDEIKEIFIGFKKGQKMFGETLAAIINTAILGIIYFIIVGLTSFLALVFKKNFLELKINKSLNSYWENLNIGSEKKEAYYKQF